MNVSFKKEFTESFSEPTYHRKKIKGDDEDEDETEHFRKGQMIRLKNIVEPRIENIEHQPLLQSEEISGAFLWEHERERCISEVDLISCDTVQSVEFILDCILDFVLDISDQKISYEHQGEITRKHSQKLNGKELETSSPQYFCSENNEAVYQTIPMGIFVQTFTENSCEDNLNNMTPDITGIDASWRKKRVKHILGEPCDFREGVKNELRLQNKSDKQKVSGESFRLLYTEQ